MSREDVNNSDQLRLRWFIDLAWYESRNRSFSSLARERLCSKCRRRLKADEREIPEAELLTAIEDCCSQKPDFITCNLPVLESIFRLFLANGNQPLDLEELGKQLSECYEGVRHSPEILSRLLENDQYYGLSQVAG